MVNSRFCVLAALLLLPATAKSQSAPVASLPLSGAETVTCMQSGKPRACPVSVLADKGTATANVLTYGADPTGVVASDSAFTAAFSAANMVHVPAGTYKLANPLSVPTGETLYGDGFQTVLRSSNSMGVITFPNGATNVEVRDMSIVVTGASFGGIVTLNTDLATAHIRRVKFSDTGVRANGILLVADTAPHGIKDVTIEDCLFDHNGAGGVTLQNHLANPITAVQDIKIRNNRFVGSGALGILDIGTGISVSGLMELLDVSGNVFDSVFGASLEVIGSSYSRFDNNRFVTPLYRPIQAANTQLMTDNTYRGNIIIGGPSTTEVYIDSTTNSVIEGNVIDLRAGTRFLYLAGSIAGTGANKVSSNTVLTSGVTALIIDNSPNNIINNNLLDNSASGTNNGVLQFYAAGAVSNTAVGNTFHKGTGGGYWSQTGGAANNLAYNNTVFGGTNAYTVLNGAGEFEGTLAAGIFTVPAASAGVPGSITQTVTIAKAAAGMLASWSYSAGLPSGVIGQAISQGGGVVVTFFNWSTGTATISAGTLTARVRPNGNAM